MEREGRDTYESAYCKLCAVDSDDTLTVPYRGVHPLMKNLHVRNSEKQQETAPALAPGVETM